MEVDRHLELAQPATRARAAGGQMLDAAAAKPTFHFFQNDVARVPGTTPAIHHEQQ
jgi:hypothetical protein